MRQRTGLRAAIIVGALFLTYAFFYQGGGWNQNARFDLVRAIVEQHTLRIDDYHTNTGDKALVDGHYYSDKAPGVAFVVVPPVAAARPVLDAVGIDSTSTNGLRALSYLATLVGAAVPAAVAAFGIYWLAQRLGASSAGATFAAVAFGLATPMWAYATLFWGHAITAALLFGGFAAAVCLRDRASPRRDQLLGGLLGVAVGWAIVSDYTSAVPAALIAGLGVNHVWDRALAPRARIMAAMAGGALACGIVLIVHNVLAFGSPFELSYSQTVNHEMSQGFFGVQTPDLGVLREIVLGRYRGLLLLAPVVIAAPIGLFLLAKKRELRAAVVVAGCIPVYYLLVNAGYATWDGGWTYGPRFLAPALPFLCLPLAAVWTRARHLVRVPLLALLLWGAALSLVAVSTTAQPPDVYKSPVTELLWPSFRDGRFSLTALDSGRPGGSPLFSVEDGDVGAAWNLGEKLGLAGHASIVPVFLLWLAAAVGWWVAGRKPARREQHLLSAFSARPVEGQRATRAPAAQRGLRAGGP